MDETPAGLVPTTPKDHSLDAYKAWLISQTQQQGGQLFETDFTEVQWQQMHEDYWQRQ